MDTKTVEFPCPPVFRQLWIPYLFTDVLFSLARWSQKHGYCWLTFLYSHILILREFQSDWSWRLKLSQILRPTWLQSDLREHLIIFKWGNRRYFYTVELWRLTPRSSYKLHINFINFVPIVHGYTCVGFPSLRLEEFPTSMGPLGVWPGMALVNEFSGKRWRPLLFSCPSIYSVENSNPVEFFPLLQLVFSSGFPQEPKALSSLFWNGKNKSAWPLDKVFPRSFLKARGRE
jgi:hypothetical protein